MEIPPRRARHICIRAHQPEIQASVTFGPHRPWTKRKNRLIGMCGLYFGSPVNIESRRIIHQSFIQKWGRGGAQRGKESSWHQAQYPHKKGTHPNMSMDQILEFGKAPHPPSQTLRFKSIWRANCASEFVRVLIPLSHGIMSLGKLIILSLTYEC